MDDLTPLEPDYQELLPQQDVPTSHSYGTGRHPEKPARKWPVILLIALLLGANVLTIFALMGWGDGGNFVLKPLTDPSGTGLRLTSQEQEQNDRQTGVSITPATGEPLELTELYPKVSPSVVVVSTSSGTGTGVIMSADGYLLTNARGLNDRQEISVYLHDGTVFGAAVVGKEPEVDLAVLKIEAQGLTAAQFGDSDAVNPGARVVALTNLFGVSLPGTMTEGNICAVNTGVQVYGRTLDVFQTDAAPVAEQAGGPLFDEYGQVIGMRIHRLGDLESFKTVEEIGFALPTRELETLVCEIMAREKAGEAVDLGIEVAEVPVLQKLYWQLPDGVMIQTIDKSSGVYEAGLRKGDLIVAIGTESVTDPQSYARALENHAGADTLRIYIYRSGRQYYADVSLK